MSAIGNQASLGSLLLLADGRLPVGAHANGAGVEWAARHDDLADMDVLERWIHGRLMTTGTVDAAFAVAASTSPADPGRFHILDAELCARIVGVRARLVSRQLGRQFVRAAQQIWPEHQVLEAPHPEGPFAPLALGSAAAGLGLDPSAVASVSFHHTIAASSTAAIRLLGLDPLAVAAMQARLVAFVEELVASASTWAVLEIEELPANSSPLAELLTEDHGQWSSRLFLA